MSREKNITIYYESYMLLLLLLYKAYVLPSPTPTLLGTRP